MSFSPEIEKTDTEIVIKYPKHSDLDIKFYNPEIIQSLGFVGATVHLDTLEPSNSGEKQFGGGLFDYEAAPEQPIETLSYPYRYFAYMFRSLSPNVKSSTDSTSSVNEPTPSGFMSTIMGLSTSVSASASASASSNTTGSGFFSMFLNKKSLTKNATVVKPVVETPLEVINPLSPESSSTKPQNSVMESLFPSTNTKPEEPKEEEPKVEEPSSIIGSLFPSTKSETKEPKVEEHKEDEANVEEPKVEEPKVEEHKEDEAKEVKPSSIMGSLFPSSDATTTTPSVDKQTISVPESVPDSSLPIPFAPLNTPFSAKWVVHIPIASNKEFNPVGVAEKDSAAFDDVLVFSQMEARNGIYVRGNFVDVLGKRVKIGSVEQLGSGEKMRTVKEYLSGRVLLEGTKMHKYSLLLNDNDNKK